MQSKPVEVIVRRHGPSFAPITDAKIRVITVETAGGGAPKSVHDAPYPPHTEPVRLVRVNARPPRKGQAKRR